MSKERFLIEAVTYEINTTKWAAAEKYAAERGMKFIILTEDEIFADIKRKKK